MQPIASWHLATKQRVLRLPMRRNNKLIAFATTVASRKRDEMANIQNLVDSRSSLPAPVAPRLNFIAAIAFLAPAGLGALATLLTLNPVGAILGVLLGLLLAKSPKIARQWERAVVLRLGKFVGLRGPGLFWVIPFVDQISALIDHSVITPG